MAEDITCRRLRLLMKLKLILEKEVIRHSISFTVVVTQETDDLAAAAVADDDDNTTTTETTTQESIIRKTTTTSTTSYSTTQQYDNKHEEEIIQETRAERFEREPSPAEEIEAPQIREPELIACTFDQNRGEPNVEVVREESSNVETTDDGTQIFTQTRKTTITTTTVSEQQYPGNISLMKTMWH